MSIIMLKSSILSHMIILMVSFLSCVHCACHKENWWRSFNSKGLSKCGSSSDNINGFFRSNQNAGDSIYLLEEANCCTRSSAFSGDESQVMYADWYYSFDRNYHWNSCPNGYFLNGLWRSSGDGGLWLIEEGRCSKPASHPHHYGHCYDKDVTTSFDLRGDSNCRPDYFITGLYRGGCAKLHCLEKFRCCKMASGPDTLDSLAAVKTRIMDTTMSDISYLANYLGYGWCGGCMAPYVGEDFRRNGDTWEADKTRRCDGYKADYRLSMNYGDWHFAMKDIKYGQPVFEDLQPETIDSGTITNYDSTPATKVITRELQSVRTVTHTKTSSWKSSLELGVDITYTPPSISGGVGGGVSYKFGYETSTTTQDSKGKQQVNTFTVQEQKTLEAYSAVNWTLILSKTRVTTPYTATIIAQFSTELRGFLRWGGGAGKPGTNYHYRWRGSGDRPTFNYRFGNSHTPFYEALKRESETVSRPWLWNDMMSAHGGARGLINSLTNQGRYEFNLNGKFEDVHGEHVSFKWQKIDLPHVGRHRRSTSNSTEHGDGAGRPDVKVIKTVAKMMPGDPAPLFPDPPEVVIDKGTPYDVKLPLDTIV